MKCPIHIGKMKVSRDFTIPNGYDPKMKRWACLSCVDYWFTSPKHCKPVRFEEVEQLELVK